ncbi:MAG: hypothetical protein EA424_01075, partial [Planctomycetaceae bacterium]
MDLLVADDDLPKMDTLFARTKTSLPCDVYSVSGLTGSDFRKMAYYPPHLAEQLISRGVPFKNHYRVADTRDHFLSLAYHA